MTEDTGDAAERRARRREIKRRYVEKNADKIREQRRRYRQEHKAEIAEYVRQYRAKNFEQVRERNRKWRAKNPEKVRAQQRRDASLRRSMQSIHGRGWDADLTAFWEAQDGRCYLCGKELHEDQFPNPRGQGPAIDHDHRCCRRGRSCRVCRRGLACRRCNTTIGLFGDNPALLRRVADALETALAIVDERLKNQAEQGELF